MSAYVQQIVALIAVGGAASYVAGLIVFRLRRKSSSGCGSACGGCSSAADKSLGRSKAFVGIDSLNTDKR